MSSSMDWIFSGGRSTADTDPAGRQNAFRYGQYPSPALQKDRETFAPRPDKNCGSA